MGTHMTQLSEMQPVVIIRPEQLGVQSPIIDVQMHGQTALFRHQDGTMTELGQGVLRMVTSAEDLISAAQILSNGEQLLVRYHDGRVRMWGEFYRTDVPMPTDLTDIVQIALSYTLAIAVRRDGSVVVWGNNQHEQCVIPESAYDICEVSIGRQHVLARRHDGTVITWGKHRNHPLTEVPTQVQGATQVCAQNACSAALTPDGRVIVWGINSLNHPMLATLPTVTQVATGVGSLAVLTADQQVIVWGEIWRDQRVPHVMSLDDDDVRNQAPIMRCLVPADMGQVTHIAFGLMSTDGVFRNGDLIVTAVTDTGCVLVWGLESETPVLPPDIPAGSRLSVGMHGVAAIQPAGSVQFWLANLESDTRAHYDAIALRNDIEQIGMGHVPMVLYRDGTFVSGDVQIADVAQVVQRFITVVRKTDGSVLNMEWEPTVILSDVMHIAMDADSLYLVAVHRDGTVAMYNPHDIDEPRVVLDSLTDVSATAVNALGGVIGLRRDGSVVVHQGDADPATMAVPVAAHDIVQVLTVWNTYMALRRDGRVVVWGSSQLGWCDVPADAIDVSQLVGQVHGHMVVVCRDGRVVSWGGQRVTDVARMIQQGLIMRIG